MMRNSTDLKCPFCHRVTPAIYWDNMGDPEIDKDEGITCEHCGHTSELRTEYSLVFNEDFLEWVRQVRSSPARLSRGRVRLKLDDIGLDATEWIVDDLGYTNITIDYTGLESAHAVTPYTMAQWRRILEVAQ